MNLFYFEKIYSILYQKISKMNENEDEFECPVCFEYMLEEICMCNNGHNICKYCKNYIKPKRCPICRAQFIDGRNFALEKIIRNTYLRCKNEGCQLKLQGKHMLNHYLECSHGKTACILFHTGCKWKGKMSSLKRHINKKHRDSINQWFDHGSFFTFLTFKFGECFVVYLKNEGENQLAATVKQGFVKSYAADFKFMLDYVDDENRGYELIVAAPCIEKCYFHEIFETDFVEVPHKMIRKLQHELDIHINVTIDRWDNPIE